MGSNTFSLFACFFSKIEIGILFLEKTKHDGNIAMEHERHRKWGHYRGLDALRPSLVFLFVVLVFLVLHIVWVGMCARRRRRVSVAMS